MGISLEDVSPLIKQRAEETRQKRLDQLRHQIGVAKTMKELQVDPRWNIYAEHIEALRESVEQETRGYEQSLNGNEFLEPKRYGQLKMEQARAKARAEAYREVLEVVKRLVVRGDLAAAQMDGPQAA